MANTEGGRLIYRPGSAIAALDPIPLSSLGDALASFYNGRRIDLETYSGEIAIAMGAGEGILPILQAGGAFTQLGVASPWTYGAIYSTLTLRQRQELARQGHTQLRATYAPDLFGIQDPGKPEGVDHNELIHIISPDLPQKLQVLSTTGGFRFQYKKEVVAPYTSDYFFLQGQFESATKGLINLVEREMFRRRAVRRSTGPRVSANTVVRAALLECIANS